MVSRMKRRRATPDSAETPAAALERRIGYQFRDAALLQLALTHSSLAFEQADPAGTPNRTTDDNEQLEFLGDAVAGLLITELLCQHFPERREGDLTRMRALLVSGKRTERNRPYGCSLVRSAAPGPWGGREWRSR